MRRLLVCSLLFLPGLAWAQGNSSDPMFGAPADSVALPERVVTATRVPTLAERIPAGVTVIDRATIETRGYTTLAEALDEVPGLHMVQSGNPGGNASVFIRGMNSNQVLVLRDGVPINDPSDPSGSFNFGVDTLADIERIEVVRGPMSGLYGSGAMGGVINLITRQGSGGPHFTATAGGGLPTAGLFGASAYGKQDMVDYNIVVESRSDSGSDNTPQREAVYTGARNGLVSQLATVNLGITPIEGTRFYALMRYRYSTFNLDELGSPAYDATDYMGHDRSVLGRVGVNSKLFDGVWETGLSVAHLDTLRRYFEPLEAADPNVTSGVSRYNGRRTAFEWNNTVHIADAGPTSGTALTFGTTHYEDFSSSYASQVYAGFPYTTNVDASARYSAGAAGLQTVLFKRLTITTGMREESATYGGSAFTWRLGGVLALPEIWSRLKLSYGTAFLAPSLFQLFGVDSYGFVGNPNLKPERSRGGEVGWAVDVPIYGRRDGATLEVTYFANRIRDLIQIVYSSNYASSTPENVAEARTSGVESSLTLRPVDWADAVLTYTFTEAYDQDGQPLLRRPRNQASATLRLRPLAGLTIAPQLTYASGAADYIVNDAGYPAGLGMTQPGVILNLTVNYEVTKYLTMFAIARNLTYSRYEPASGYQTPGPSFIAGARMRF